MSRPPAVQFYPKDWLAKTLPLTLEQEGCFIRLWVAARSTSEDWCSLPNDDRKLAALARVTLRKWMQLRAAMVPDYFVEEGDRLVNIRLREEAEIQEAFRAAGAIGGKAAASRLTSDQRRERATHASHARRGPDV